MKMSARTPAIVALAALALLAFEAVAAAQGTTPFGVGRAEPAINPSSFGPLSGVASYIAVKQAEIYRLFASAMRQAAHDPTAIVTIIGLCLAYGVLHAAGPGHGKAVISSYLFATRETLRRGIVISFAASLVQGAMAIALVGVFALFFKATAAAMDQASRYAEIVSYGLVALIGGVLLVRKLAGLWPRHRLASAGGVAAGHLDDGTCCDGHAADPRMLQGKFDLRSAALAVFAVGARPCTGAVLVLVFALAQGVFAVGILGVLAISLGTGATVGLLAALAVGAQGLAMRLAARRSGLALAFQHIFEIGGALFVLLFGLTLLSAALISGPASL